MQTDPPLRTGKIGVSSGQIVAARGNNGNPFTQADRDAFLDLPGGRWFQVRDVPFQIRNARHRCDRLVDMGVLESRVIGESPRDVETVYRKKVGAPFGAMQSPGLSGGKTLALAGAGPAARGRVDPDQVAQVAMAEETEHSGRGAEPVALIHAAVRRAHAILDRAKQSSDQLKREGYSRLSGPVSTSLDEAHARLQAAVEYLDAVLQREV